MEKTNRLMSLDAFRGFDMFWIMGGFPLAAAICALFGYTGFKQDFGHVGWEGLQFLDTVFPTFLFLAGVSFPFSAAKSLERGMSRNAIALKALKRGVILFVLGMVYSGLLQCKFATCRVPTVLGYIGIGWMVSAWIYLYVRDVRTRLAIAVGILAAVTLFFGFVPAPDAPAGAAKFSPEWHFGCWLDRTLLKGHLIHANFDNEGFAGLLPCVVTAMLGVFAGEIVRFRGLAATGRKTLALLGAAAVCLVSGLALARFYPIVKNLWSPSFVLVVGSYSFAMFALFYWLVDVRGWRNWCFFFKVIGMNSITIYLGQAIFAFGNARDFLFRGVASLLPKLWGDVVLAVGYIAVCWLILLFLYRKQTFLRV